MEKELILCDTNIFIHWFSGNKKIDDILRTKIGLGNVVLPVIVYMELLQGMSNKKELADMQKKLSKFHLININNSISDKTKSLITKYSLSQSLQIPDAFIGATAIECNLRLYTYNIKDFKFIPDIRLYDEIL